MTRETKSKLTAVLFEWIKPLLAAAIVAVIAFVSRTDSTMSVNASEIGNIKTTQTKLQNEVMMLQNNMESKTDESLTTREHNQFKAELDKKADKEAFDHLNATVQKIDDRTYQILMILKNGTKTEAVK